ncbi:uncharacterized protein LOC122665942 [Telopea speciosissima]|uniref:uncharacterized protein LOC122665942 n=1 Tax=Telopea speciosissima TaxID=54955 RepID=UPI001CC5374C|nr:uncharacterized protein LOC122665942 [Telopea speciosissima]
MSDWFKAWDPIFSVDKKKAQDLFSLATFIIWYIWRARNDIIFKHHSWSPVEVIKAADKAFHEFNQVTKTPHNISPPMDIHPSNIQVPSHKWIPPFPWVKLNVDAVWNKVLRKGDIGNIIRDHSGLLLSAYSFGVHCDSTFIGEAIAIHSGLLLDIRGGFSNVLVESDCSCLINQLSSSEPEIAIDSIFHDIVHLQKSFVECSISYVPRSVNSVADSLARSALSVESPIVWPLTSPWLLYLCETKANVCNDSLIQ